VLARRKKKEEGFPGDWRGQLKVRRRGTRNGHTTHFNEAPRPGYALAIDNAGTYSRSIVVQNSDLRTSKWHGG
jgi:hypothetical protein